MEISKRLLAPIYKIENQNPQIDLDAFVKRFLLFDHYILDSVRLREIPLLIETFSLNGFLSLLESGILSISCLQLNTGSLGPSLFIDNSPPNKIRPPFNYSLGTISFAEPLNQINEFVDQIIPALNLHGRQSIQLRKALFSVTKYQLDDDGKSSVDATTNELLIMPSLLAHACSISAKRQLGVTINPSNIEVIPQQLSPNDIKVKSNLMKDFGICQLDAHKIIEGGILAIAKRNDRINQMKFFSCLTGFSDEDLPIFGKRLDFLAKSLDPENTEKQFQRVIEIRGLPAILPNSHLSLDAKELIKLHESHECLQFRRWLSESTNMTDKEIKEQGSTITNRIGSFVRSDFGRSIRFLLTNAIGFVPGLQVPAIALSAIDEFLLDQVFPYSGPISFIDNLYPSIFENT